MSLRANKNPRISIEMFVGFYCILIGKLHPFEDWLLLTSPFNVIDYVIDIEKFVYWNVKKL